MMYLGLLSGEEYGRMLKGTSELCRPRGKPLSPKVIFETVFPQLLRQQGIPYRRNNYHNGSHQTNGQRKRKPRRVSAEATET